MDKTNSPTSEAPVAKKAKISQETDGDQAFSLALEGIESIEAQINTIEDEQSLEICKLEQKYVEKKQPYYNQREQHISKIDKFWMIALMNHPNISCLITEEDEDCLNYLEKIVVDQKSKDVEAEDEEGNKFMKSLNFKVVFHFKEENPYFSNKTLTKSYYQVMDEIVSDGDKINWKDEDKNLIELCRAKADLANAENSVKNGAGDAEDQDAEKIEHESFFSWFEDHEDPEGDETGEMIKDDLWLRALSYYVSEDIEEDGDDEGEVDLEEGSGAEEE